MELLSKDTLKKLIETRSEPCVSIYLPTERIGQDTEQNPIRMKNQLTKAEGLLKEEGLRKNEIDKILAPVHALVEQRSYWQQQSYGLAVFLSDGEAVVHQLPLSFEEFVFVGSRYYLKPIMPLLSGDGRFYLLHLNLEDSVLYQASRYAMDTVDVPDMPKGIDDALRYDDPEKQLQHATTNRTDGGHDAIHHGHGDDYDKKENILRYFHQVDDAVKSLLADETAPLILTGVGYLLPIYKETNEYPHLLEADIGTDVSEMDAKMLHQRAWEAVEPHFQKEQEAASNNYFVAREEGLSSKDLKEIVRAAYYGRVHTLFVALNEQRWGVFNPKNGEVNLTEEKEGQDLLDLAAVHTLSNGGSVYAVDSDQVPDGGAAAAVFRYPLE